MLWVALHFHVPPSETLERWGSRPNSGQSSNVLPAAGAAAGIAATDAVGDGPSVQRLDRPIAAELKLVLLVTVALTLLFILFPDPIVGGAEAAAKSLFAR